MLERLDRGLCRSHDGHAVIGIQQEVIALPNFGPQSAHAAQHRYSHGPRHDHDVAGERTFLEQHALEPAAIVFQQFGRAQVARDQDGIAAQA